MAAPKGNQFNVKLKDPEMRQRAYKAYCEYIKEGMPLEYFTFIEGEYGCCKKTLENYIKSAPDDFPAILMKEAYRERYKKMHEEGMKLMQGTYKNGSPVVWQTLMRNMFKDLHWDKDEISQNNVSNDKLEQIKNFVIEQASALTALEQAKAQNKDHSD